MEINDDEMLAKVTFVPKSPSQPDNCFNHTAKYKCTEKATLEAVFAFSHIRCCENRSCKIFAARIALLALRQMN